MTLDASWEQTERLVEVLECLTFVDSIPKSQHEHLPAKRPECLDPVVTEEGVPWLWLWTVVSYVRAGKAMSSETPVALSPETSTSTGYRKEVQR
jgi:hypothetical protein